MHALVLLCIDQHMTFESLSFTDSKDMIGGQNLKKTDHLTLTMYVRGCFSQFSLCTKFDHYSFSRSRDMVGAHQNLNGSRDLTTPRSQMVCDPYLSTKFEVLCPPTTKIWKAIQNVENGCFGVVRISRGHWNSGMRQSANEFLFTIHSKLDGCIVLNAHNTVFALKRALFLWSRLSENCNPFVTVSVTITLVDQYITINYHTHS